MEKNEKKNEVTYLRDSVNSVKVIRGQRGSYGWEIKVHNNDLGTAVATIKGIDKELNETFGGDK